MLQHLTNLISSNDQRNVDYGTATVKTHDKDQDQKCVLPYFPQRYYVTLMAFFGFGNLYALRIGVSVAVVGMKLENGTLQNNSTIVMKFLPFTYTQ